MPDWNTRELTPGQLSERSGVAVSALHFYEREGLISSRRTSGNQRRYKRDVLRRVAFVRLSQKVGIPLAEIRDALSTLPTAAPPTAATGRGCRAAGTPTSTGASNNSPGCATTSPTASAACLSLASCTLANPHDELGTEGPGARVIDVEID